MSWSWSHTQEAKTNAEANLLDLPLTERQVIFAEWFATTWGCYSFPEGDIEPLFDLSRYYDGLYRACHIEEMVMNEYIWFMTENWKTCDNGGRNAYVCPEGCHTVPFDR